MKLQALKRAFNYGVESGLIAKNPIRGYRIPKESGRITYLTPEQEASLCKHASEAMAMAIQVCIRTGARTHIEFGSLEARHVIDEGKRMAWVFPADESKNRRQRIIRITDEAIMVIVRKQMKLHRKGPIFRNEAGTPWLRNSMSKAFCRARRRAEVDGMKFDADCCLYSCRHTYAKRMLQGFWSGKAVAIEVLAKLMDNSVDVCRRFYLQWSESYAETLWDNA
jgi:integrase